MAWYDAEWVRFTGCRQCQQITRRGAAECDGLVALQLLRQVKHRRDANPATDQDGGVILWRKLESIPQWTDDVH